MAAAVALQREWLEWSGAGGKVLIIDAEQGLRTIKRRLREAGLDHAKKVDYLRVPDGLNLDEDNGADVLRLEALLEAGGYDLVIADPLYKLHRGDSNEERQAVDLMRRLDHWREQWRFALLMLVHLRKPPPQGARFSIHEFFGSGGYLRGAEGRARHQAHHPRLREAALLQGPRRRPARRGELGADLRPPRGLPARPQRRSRARDGDREGAESARGATRANDRGSRQGHRLQRQDIRGALKKLGAEHQPGPHGAKLWSLPAAEESDDE